MNQNLLIVDDEYEILSWLDEMFQFDFDMEIGVYTASSACEALVLLNQIKFDVVLTDIRMPGMDGITLFHKIKQNWPRCKVVFLTGYRNFEDVYQIVNHKDIKYILKSEEDEVIMQAVRNSLAEFRRELENEVLQQKQEADLEKVKFWMGRELLRKMMCGELQKLSKENISERCREAGTTVDFSKHFLLFLLRLDGGIEEGVQFYDTEVLFRSVEVAIRDNLPDNIAELLYVSELRKAFFFVQGKADSEWGRIFAVSQGAVEYAQHIFHRNYQTTFSAVVASTPVDCQELSKKIVEMRQIMVSYLGREQEVIVHAEAMVTEKAEQDRVRMFSRVPLLKSYLELQHRSEYYELLSECCKELVKTESRHDTYAMELYYSVSVLLLQFINENHMNEKIAFRIGTFKLTMVDAHDSWMEAGQYLFDISEAVFELLGDSGAALSDRALKRVCDYIEQNLSGDLSQTCLAGVGGFNTSYLSRLFKQVYQVTLTDYIYQKRMELAEKLLESTNKKIQDIAVETGYLSAHSFARTFRSFAGVSPVEYRELHRK